MRFKIFYKTARSRYDGYYFTPTKFTYVLSTVMMLAGAFCLAYALSYSVFATGDVMTEREQWFFVFSLPLGMLLTVSGAVMCKLGQIALRVRIWRNGKWDRKRKKMHNAHVWDQMELEFGKNCANAVNKNLFDQSSATTDMIAYNTPRLMDCLSFGRSKREYPSFHSMSTITDAIPFSAKRTEVTKECNAYVDELRDLARIWSSNFGLCGVRLSLYDARGRSVCSEFDCIRKLGMNMGIEESVDSYYKGVPIEDIIA